MSHYAKVALALVLLLAFVAENWYVLNLGKRSERSAWQAKELTRQRAESQALFKATENNLREQQDNEAKARKVSHDHQKELAAIRDYQPRAGGLRLPRALCDRYASSTEAASTSGFNGAAASTLALPDQTGRAVDEFAASLRQLARDADTATAIARGLQSFAKENGFYGIKQD